MKISLEIPESMFRSQITEIVADQVAKRSLDGGASEVFEDEKFDEEEDGDAQLEPPPASPNERAPEKTEHEVLIGILTDIFYSKIASRGLLDEDNKLTDKEREMLLTQLKAIGLSAAELRDIIKDYGHAPAWAESKITVAANDMSKLMSYMMAEVQQLEAKTENKRSTMKIPKTAAIRKAEEMKCLSSESIEDGRTRYTMSGAHRAWFPLENLAVSEVQEERGEDGRGRPPKYYNIEGIASSTSIDSYGTEMSYEALVGMSEQMQRGVPILPAHAGKNGGVAEWDEVIGRSYDASIVMTDDVAYAADRADKQYTLILRSRLYGDEEVSRKLIRRLKRGEPIGQSIGGWFEKVDVIENMSGEIERIVVRSVTLDHIAVTRAPANPDSYGLMTHSIRSKIQEMKAEVKKEPIEKLEERKPDIKRHIISLVEEDDCIVARFEKDADFSMFKVDGALDLEKSPVIEERNTMQEERQDEAPAEERTEAEAEERTNAEPTEERKAYLDTEETIIAEPYDGGGPASEEGTPDPLDELNASADDNQNADPDGEAFPDDSNERNPMLEVTEDRTVMKYRDDMPLAEVDKDWEWNTTAQDEVLGEGLDNWKRYAVAHLYMDNGKDWETKEAYKLPIAKMDDGELRVFFKACAAALAALNGARGGVKGLTQEEREIAHSVLAKYYKKFDKEIPALKGAATAEELSDSTPTAQYIEETPSPELDKLSALKHSGIENDAKAQAQPESNSTGEDMTENDIKKIADLLRSGLDPITARLDALENTQQETRSAEPTRPANKEEAKTLPADVVKLQERLQKTEDMLLRVMETPIRQGRHTTIQVRGGSVGAESALDGLVNRAKEVGAAALPALVARHKETLAEETEVSKMQINALKDLLAAGLRAAEVDGLLSQPHENNWQ